MKFKTKEKTIKEFIEFCKTGNLNLQPVYQRNPIWTTKAKQDLIDTIFIGYPLPNFFIYEEDDSMFEMVDGQQRSRTILGYFDGKITDSENKVFDELLPKKKEKFLNYTLILTYISDVSKKEEKLESIEDFYYKVNNTGLRLNKPESRKAKYYETILLELVEDLLSLDDFVSLNIFTQRAQDRMNDADFISELLILLKFGNTDKKIKVEDTFEKDITADEAKELHNEFVQIISHVLRFNKIYPINKTRYKQRNDFFTLFGFLKSHKDINEEILDYFYEVLVWIQNEIKPNSKCKPFFDYATNCVSQSNSKNARVQRLNFFEELFINTKNKPNELQLSILEYYKNKHKYKNEDMIKKIDQFLTLNIYE
ncbi:MAG: DUF262 domain-containing protein [Candidatus Cloacimonetes bacterium]|nr:DUF262 domain-containing protein [Candidatus Cloacimonadota bacterium]